jgi:hypothetical protein
MIFQSSAGVRSERKMARSDHRDSPCRLFCDTGEDHENQNNDPGKMMRWAMASLDPKVLNLMLQSINPNAYLGWLGATMNPASGDMWKGFLTPTPPAPPKVAPAAK